MKRSFLAGGDARPKGDGQVTNDALDRLTPFGWRGGLIFIFGFCCLSFLLCGYFIAYWRNADMDFVVVYNALMLNDGAKRAYFDHPGYLTILSVETWFRLLHNFHLLDGWTLSAIPPSSDRVAFDAAMTSVVRSGRILAGLTACAFVLAFAALARRIVTDWRIAMCAVSAFAISGGVQMHLRILRTEMIAACLCILALMILIVVARRATAWRPLALAIAAAFCVLGLENKVQVVLLIAAIPALILPFGTKEGRSVEFWQGGWRAWSVTLGAGLLAALAFSAAFPLIAGALDPVTANAAGLKPLLFGRFGVYQLALLGWIAICMAAFARGWRVSMPETLTAVLCVVIGASLALLALYIQYDIKDAVAVLNPIEKMLVYVDDPAASNSLLSAIGFLVSGVLRVLQRYTFVLFSSPRPTVFLTWLVIPGIVVAWRRGERQAALQASMLMLAAIGIDAIGVRRGLKLEYFVLTDPLIIIAGMVLLDRMRDFRFHKWAFPVGAALIALHVGVSQAEPVKMMLKKKGPEDVCEWNQFYMPELPLSWCAGVRK